MTRVLDNQTNIVFSREFNTRHNVFHVGDIDRVACVVSELTRRIGRRKGVARFILERCVHYAGRIRHTTSKVKSPNSRQDRYQFMTY